MQNSTINFEGEIQMTTSEELKEEYTKNITELTNTLKKNAKRLFIEGSEDEAILENIKVNVVDIFYKMFQVSYNKTCKNVEQQAVELDKLKTAYLEFFHKIPTAWLENMGKAKENNLMVEYYKEQIKLETVGVIKELFMEHYNRYSKEN